MKIISSFLANIVWVSYIAVYPAGFFGILFFLRFGPSNNLINLAVNILGEDGIFLVPFLLYAVFWVIIFMYCSIKRPTYLEWIGDELEIGYRAKKNTQITLSDIEHVEHINPTKSEQILKFHLKRNHDFVIVLDEYEARKAVKKLREDQIEVLDIYL